MKELSMLVNKMDQDAINLLFNEAKKEIEQLIEVICHSFKVLYLVFRFRLETSTI